MIVLAPFEKLSFDPSISRACAGTQSAFRLGDCFCNQFAYVGRAPRGILQCLNLGISVTQDAVGFKPDLIWMLVRGLLYIDRARLALEIAD